MDALASGLITLSNGFVTLLGRLLSPVAAALLLCALCLAWLAAVRIEELDRQGTKPMVGRH